MVPSWHEDNELDEQDKFNLAEFRKLIDESQNEFVKLVKFPDELLLKIIRRPKLDLAESLRILTNIVEARFTTHLLTFERAYPSAVRHVFEKRIFGVLKHRDQLGRVVVWLRLGRWDPNEVPERDLHLALCLTLWELLDSKTTQMKGIVGILDAAGCSRWHLSKATPQKIQKHVKLFLKCNPVQVRGGHVMFAPMIFNIIFSIFKQFLPKQYAKLLHFNGKNVRKLQEHVPVTILPNFLGGTLTETEATNREIINRLLKKDEDYQDMIQLGKKEYFECYPEKKMEFGKFANGKA